MKTRAAVAFEAKKPLEIVELDLDGPKAGEVLVEIKATGICHTDAYTLDGFDSEGIFPSILGHEGAGIVREVGTQTRRLSLGTEWNRTFRDGFGSQYNFSASLRGDGYSITEFGAKWLANPERRTSADPSRMSEKFGSFSKAYGTGFSQRATEAIRCHRTGNYLASCVMAGAAAESILLAVAIAKAKDEGKVLKTYEKSGGRLAVTRIVTTGLSGSLQRQFEAALQVLHYWRDDAAHGKATAISEVEAHASLTQLLRLAHFSDDNWAELTT